MLNVLKVIEYEGSVAIEYETTPGYPDTFTCTWDELFLRLPVEPPPTRAEAVILAALLLKQKFDGKESGKANPKSLLDIVRTAIKDDPL